MEHLMTSREGKRRGPEATDGTPRERTCRGGGARDRGHGGAAWEGARPISERDRVLSLAERGETPHEISWDRRMFWTNLPAVGRGEADGEREREREREPRRATAEREVEVMPVYYLKRANNYSNSKNKIRIANFETKICKPGLETMGNPNLCVLCVSGNTGNCSIVIVSAYLTRIFMPTAFGWAGIQHPPT